MPNEKNVIIQFCQLVRERSAENWRVFQELHRIKSLSQQLTMLRQELDSMVRVIFLLSISDREYRLELMRGTLAGAKWRKPNSNAVITDKDMVELSNTLHGWVKYVYSFGCAFIHLTIASSITLQDRLSSFTHLTEDDRTAIIEYLRSYHGGPSNDDPMMIEIEFMLEGVFEKITGNLECYLRDLEKNGELESEDTAG